MRRWASLLAWIAASGLSAGCFADPSSDEECNPGSEGCACVDLQCEEGLACMGGVCVSDGGSTSGVTSSPNPTSPISAGPTTDVTTTAGSTSTTTATTGPGDSSSSGPPPGEESSSSGGGDVCGDFVVGPTEECDGGNGCSGECELEIHDCNPLNNVPCPAGQRCSWQLLTEDPFEAYFTCLPLSDMPLPVGEGDCFEGGDSQDRLCEIGLACLNSQVLDGCAFDGCCTEYCDINDVMPSCSQDGDTCVAEPDLAPGLASLGTCRPP